MRGPDPFGGEGKSVPMSAQRNNQACVLFASAGVGAGHNQASRALMAGLRRADPTIRTEWIDVLDVANPLFRLYYAGGYAAMVTRFPRIYGLGYRFTDHPRGPRRTLAERRRLWTERWAIRRLTPWLLARRPAVVVGTHFLIPPFVGRLIERGVEGLRQMVVITDHCLHRYWCAEHVERFFVPDENGRDRLVDFGVADDRIVVSGIPVHPKWTDPIDAAAARAAWELPEGRPMILMTGGTNFTVGRIDALALRLCRRIPHALVLVLAGTNKKLLGRLAARPEATGDSPQLRPVGFTDRVHELVQLADLVITKTGALTVTECVTKAAALLVLKPVPGQEAQNARWLRDHGAAVCARDGDDLVNQAVRLIGDPAELRRLRDNVRPLATPATETIVEHILDEVKRL